MFVMAGWWRLNIIIDSGFILVLAVFWGSLFIMLKSLFIMLETAGYRWINHVPVSVGWGKCIGLNADWPFWLLYCDTIAWGGTVDDKVMVVVPLWRAIGLWVLRYIDSIVLTLSRTSAGNTVWSLKDKKNTKLYIWVSILYLLLSQSSQYLQSSIGLLLSAPRSSRSRTAQRDVDWER